MPHKKNVVPLTFKQKEKKQFFPAQEANAETDKRQITFYREVIARKLKEPEAAKKAAQIISDWLNSEK
jgi:hypothetical protein